MSIQVGDMFRYGPDVDGYYGIGIVKENDHSNIHVDWLTSKYKEKDVEFQTTVFWENDMLHDYLWRKLS